MSIVRDNILRDKTYTPFCGNDKPKWLIGGCSNPRTILNRDGQFECPECEYVTEFPDDFVKQYRIQHKLDQI